MVVIFQRNKVQMTLLNLKQIIYTRLRARYVNNRTCIYKPVLWTWKEHAHLLLSLIKQSTLVSLRVSILVVIVPVFDSRPCWCYPLSLHRSTCIYAWRYTLDGIVCVCIHDYSGLMNIRFHLSSKPMTDGGRRGQRPQGRDDS